MTTDVTLATCICSAVATGSKHGWLKLLKRLYKFLGCKSSDHWKIHICLSWHEAQIYDNCMLKVSQQQRVAWNRSSVYWSTANETLAL